MKVQVDVRDNLDSKDNTANNITLISVSGSVVKKRE